MKCAPIIFRIVWGQILLHQIPHVTHVMWHSSKHAFIDIITILKKTWKKEENEEEEVTAYSVISRQMNLKMWFIALQTIFLFLTLHWPFNVYFTFCRSLADDVDLVVVDFILLFFLRHTIPFCNNNLADYHS